MMEMSKAGKALFAKMMKAKGKHKGGPKAKAKGKGGFQMPEMVKR